MQYSSEVEKMCCVAKGPNHGPAPIPEEGKWVQAKEIKDISGLTHGIGWCAPQQGACKLTLNVKDGVIQEALVETIGCSGMTHSAAMAAEILTGKTILGALARHVSTPTPNFQPMNANYGILEPLEGRVKGKRNRYEKLSERAINVLTEVIHQNEL